MSERKLLVSKELYDVYVEGDSMIRVYKKPEYKEKCLYAALTTSRVETTLVNCTIDMPKVREVKLEDGKWVLVRDYIKGKTMTELIKEQPDKAEMYMEKLVDIQLEYQAQSMPLLSKLKDKMARQIKGLTEIDEIKKYELLTRLDSMPKHTKLCNNNFSPDNVLITDDGGVVVLDWGSSRQGNASADVAKTYLLLSLHWEKLADVYLDIFCKKTKTSKVYVQKWLPIVAAAQLEKKFEDEKDLLMKWIDVVEYD